VFLVTQNVCGTRLHHILNEIDKLEEQLQRNEEFKKALAFRESGNRLLVTNTIGAIGLYQFMPNTLKDLGHTKGTIDSITFSKTVQDRLLAKKIEKDLNLLQYQWFRGNNSIDYVSKYVGIRVQGQKVTLAGILAACHIGGTMGTIRFFDSNFSQNLSDIYGTSIKSYLLQFSRYDYVNEKQTKQKIQCLKDSLIFTTELTHLSRRLKSFTMAQNSPEMGIVMTLRYPKILNLHYQSRKYHLGYKCNCQNITEEFSNLEAQQLLITIISQQVVLVKSNGTTQDNGMVWLLPYHHLALQRKEQDYSSSILNQFGMHRGILKYVTYLQSLSLGKLINYQLPEVA
jgi:hypothetical protein